MPLKLVKRPGVENWYLRGTVRGRHVFETTGTDSRKAADEIRIKREAEILAESIHGKRAVATFAQAAAVYLENGGSPRYVGTYDEETGKWDGLIGHFGEKRLSAIGQLELDEAARKLYPAASAETRNRQVYTPFIAIWKSAEVRQLCEVRRWKRPKMTAKPLTRWVTVEELERMIGAASPHMAPLIAFLAYTGARMYEALSLEWTDVNEREAWVVFRETKRKGEDRGVPLHPVALAAVRATAARSGKVFRTQAGHPYYDTEKRAGGQVKTGWRGMCRRAEVADVTPHTMRHTFSTWLTMAGVSDRVRDELMGHASSETSRIYSHVPRAELVAAVARLPAISVHFARNPPPRPEKVSTVHGG